MVRWTGKFLLFEIRGSTTSQNFFVLPAMTSSFNDYKIFIWVKPLNVITSSGLLISVYTS